MLIQNHTKLNKEFQFEVFVISFILGETCISIKGSNQIGKYSYGQIRCKENKSVNVQRIWFDNEGSCEYETSKRKEIFNERLAFTCDSFSLCIVPFYRSNVNRNYTYLNLRFHCAGTTKYIIIFFYINM